LFVTKIEAHDAESRLYTGIVTGLKNM